jgi:RNA polymerase sigma-70 factor (ECF subfamily)
VGTTAHDSAGADDRFQALYAAHLRTILGYALRRVTAPEDAADVVAETFLIAWRRRADVPAGSEAPLWLYGVARRVLANHVRGEGRRSRLGDRLRIELSQQLTVPDPADEVVQVRAIRAAMDRLEPSDREILELTAWEQLAPREIAVALELSPEVVRARLSRARTRLREHLDAGHDRAGPGHVQGVRSALVPKEVR